MYDKQSLILSWTGSSTDSNKNHISEILMKKDVFQISLESSQNKKITQIQNTYVFTYYYAVQKI